MLKTEFNFTFIDEHDVIDQLGIYYRNRRPVLLVGEPGVGKTSLVQLVAQAAKSRLIQKMGGDYSVSRLVGAFELAANNGATETRFVPGPLLRAMQQGTIFYFDEIDATSGDCLDVLHQILDHRKTIAKADIGLQVLPGEDEFVHPHEDFWFVGSCVDKSGLPGDFIDRFRVIEVKRLSIENQIKHLSDIFDVDVDDIARLVRIGQLTIRLGWQKPASFRQIKSAVEDIADGLTLDEAIDNCLINPNANTVQDKISLRNAMNAEGMASTPVLADAVIAESKSTVTRFDSDLLPELDQPELEESDERQFAGGSRFDRGFDDDESSE